MASTFNIPLITLAVGTRDFGPAPVADTDSQIMLTIDRTVANGLNTLTSATVLTIETFQSNDGGATWVFCNGGSAPGGILPAKGGGTVTQMDIETTLDPGTSRQVKATTILQGPSSVAVAGSIVTQ